MAPIQSLWCPEGILFEKSKPVRTRLIINTPALYDENAGAVNSWWSIVDKFPISEFGKIVSWLERHRDFRLAREVS
jgi:hypothetical protein